MIDKVLGGVPVAPAESTPAAREPFGKVMKGTPTPVKTGAVPPAAPRPASTPPPRAAPTAAHRPATVPATQVVGQIAESQRKLDRILKLAESGKTFTPAELLAFQAHAYRASQEIDLAGKVVDKATGAVKQTLQTQV